MRYDTIRYNVPAYSNTERGEGNTGEGPQGVKGAKASGGRIISQQSSYCTYANSRVLYLRRWGRRRVKRAKARGGGVVSQQSSYYTYANSRVLYLRQQSCTVLTLTVILLYLWRWGRRSGREADASEGLVLALTVAQLYLR